MRNCLCSFCAPVSPSSSNLHHSQTSHPTTHNTTVTTNALPHPPTHPHTHIRPQEHFYLEPNACIVIPGEGDEYLAYASTQVGGGSDAVCVCKDAI